jgi:hypothetical protein
MDTTKRNNYMQNIKTKRAQTVAGFKKTIKSRTTTIRDKRVEKQERIYEPQGAVMSHNVTWPVGDRILNGMGDYLGLADVKTANPVGTPMYIFQKLFDFLGDSKTIILIFVLVVIVLPPFDKNKKTIQRGYFYFLMILIMLLKYSSFANQFIEKKKKDANDEALFVLHEKVLDPIYKNLESNLSCSSGVEVNMEEIYHPHGIEDVIPSAAFIFAAGMSCFSGLKTKDALFSTFTNLTRTSNIQYSNIMSGLVTSVNGVGLFFKALKLEELSTYFHIETVTDVEILNYLTKATKFLAKLNCGDVQGTAYYIDIYSEILNKGQDLIKRVEKQSYDYRILFEILKKLRDSNEKIETIRCSLNGTRIEPVGILIQGSPGVFKSIFCNRMADVVATHTIPEEWKDDYKLNSKDFHYSMPNDRFFDGYTNKSWVVKFDDIFQKRDTAGDTDSEPLKVIKMINSMEYPLPMAKVESKNSTFFRSPFVFATSNLERFGMLESIVSSSAVERRFNVKLKLSVSSKYKNVDGSTNFDLLPSSFLNLDEGYQGKCTDIPNDFWEIRMTYCKGDNVTDPVVVSFVDVAYIIVEEHRHRVKQYYE